MDKDRVLAEIARLKHLPFGSTRLEGNHARKRFALVLLTADKAADVELMSLLADWRREANKSYAKSFTVTLEGTARWYRINLIDAPDRLLFLIEAEKRYLGHVGLFRFDFADASCEIDNIVRGEEGLPGIMASSCRLMMDWGARELGIRLYHLQSSSVNTRATALYERLGFHETERVPVVLQTSADGPEWVEAPEHSGPAERYRISMEREAGDGRG